MPVALAVGGDVNEPARASLARSAKRATNVWLETSTPSKAIERAMGPS